MMGLVAYCIGMYLLGGIGTSIGYHRILTHKSADMPKWLEHAIVMLGLPAGTPIQWAGNHRAHHLHTDIEGDPHSPVLDGFWYAHCGWYIGSKNPVLCFLYAIAGPVRMLIDSIMRPRTNQEYVELAKDIAKVPFYQWISKPIVYLVVMWIYLSILLCLPYFLFGWGGVLAASITLVFIYNIGDAVDSLGHLYGDKSEHSHARNNVVLGLLAFGDGWHKNHHNRPRKAKHGIKITQFDLSFLLLKGMHKIKLVKKIY